MKKILIETNSNIGDAVMNVPIINFLSWKFPEVKIDLVCDARSVDLFRDFACISNIYIKDKKNRLDFAKFLFKSLTVRYDLAIGLRSDAIPLLINAHKKLYKDDKDAAICGKASETLATFSILRRFFPDATEKQIDTAITVSNENQVYAKSLIAYNGGEKILVVAPGANSANKVWASENFIELIGKVKSNFDKIVIVGSADENAVCERIANKCGAINLAGRTNLRQAAALFSLCNLFIGNDSGLGHIAAAQGCKTFTIFAHADISYADPVRYTPYGQHAIFRSSDDEPPITVNDVLQKMQNTPILM